MSRPHSSSVDADNAWGPSPTLATSSLPLTEADKADELRDEAELDPAEIVEKEKLIKDLVTKQDGLRALLGRITTVQQESAKIKSGNETLQTYIDNLTRNNAQAAVSSVKR